MRARTPSSTDPLVARHPSRDTGTVPTISRRQFLLRNTAVATTVMLGEGVLAEDEPRVTRHAIAVPGLRAPVRLVQLSDFHRSWCVSEAFLHRVVDKANALHADAALLTGDFVTEWTSYMASCCTALDRLKAPLGRFAVLGNHDYAADHHRGAPAIAEALSTIHVDVLTNRSVRMDNGLHLVGVDDCWYGRPDPVLAFEQVGSSEPALTLTHNPRIFTQLGRYNCVTLAGHTHGGQINLPFMTRRLMRHRHPYLKGWFSAPDGPGRLYVSRGLGVVGIPLRLRCDPEIALFDLHPA